MEPGSMTVVTSHVDIIKKFRLRYVEIKVVVHANQP